MALRSTKAPSPTLPTSSTSPTLITHPLTETTFPTDLADVPTSAGRSGISTTTRITTQQPPPQPPPQLPPPQQQQQQFYSREIHSSGSDRSSIGGGSVVVSEDEIEQEEEEDTRVDTRVDFIGDVGELQNVAAKAGKAAAMDLLNAELQKIAQTMITPKKRGPNNRRISQVPERTLSPPLPLLERKAVHVTHNALDFRGKKANPPQFNSPLHGSRSKPYARVLQASVRSCLLRSLSRATKPNESTQDTGNNSNNSSCSNGSCVPVYDYMNCNCQPEEGSGALTFDSRFESGNLRKANSVTPRTLKRKFPSNRIEECQPMEVDQEYDVWCNNDLHTRGNTQWFYFSAGEPRPQQRGSGNSSSSSSSSSSNSTEGSRESNKKSSNNYVGQQAGSGGRVVRKGLRVRFNIVNMRKSDSLCNFGMRPVVLSLKELASSNTGWQHEGKFLICVLLFYGDTRIYIFLLLLNFLLIQNQAKMYVTIVTYRVVKVGVGGG